MKVAALLVTGALAAIVMWQFGSGEWQWPGQRQPAIIIDNAYLKRSHATRKPPQETAPREQQTAQQLQSPRESAPPLDIRADDVIQGTPDSIYELPSAYRHRHVMLDQWKLGWIKKIPSSKFPPNALAGTIRGCDWYLDLGVNSGACISAVEVERITQMGRQTAWGLPYADLLCYVEEARFADGFLLTNCRAVPLPMDIEVSRENQRQQEQELQNALTDLGN